MVGLDLTSELFPPARRRAERLGVTVDWIEGDAERLPFVAGSFDGVLSAFGVLRPHGVIALVNWTPEGLIGELLRDYGRVPARTSGQRVATAALGR